MSDKQPKASRRGFFLAASVAGAAAASATWMKTQAPAAIQDAHKPAPEKGGGYSLSDHVKQYYKTTRV